MSNPKTFRINRGTWRSGRYGDDAFANNLASGKATGQSALRNREGFMCCLGFFGKACGYTNSELLGRPFPYNTTQNKWPSWMKDEHGEVLGNEHIQTLADLNDDSEISDKQREDRLRRKFRKHGVEAVFFGEYPERKDEETW